MANMSLRCCIICEEHRQEAEDAGYHALVKILEGLCDEVVDIQKRERLGGAAETYLSGSKLLLVGHRTDLRRIKLRQLATKDVLELQFTTAASAPESEADGSVSGQNVPWCSIRELCFCLSRASKNDFISQSRLNELIKNSRAEAQKTILDPLLPLAVLADGFFTSSPVDIGAWFGPGIQAALQTSSSAIYPVMSDEYWKDLARGGPAKDHLRDMIKEPRMATPGLPTVLAEAGALWPDTGDGQSDPAIQATRLYRNAYDAVKALWDALTSKEGVPPGGTEMRRLVEAASVGFQVLAAGHL